MYTGESGSGKTTLLNCLFGAEDFSGEVKINGTALTVKKRRQAAQAKHVDDLSGLSTHRGYVDGR